MNTNNVVGVSILNGILVIFIILELLGVTWPWWVVLIPLWASLELLLL